MPTQFLDHHGCFRNMDTDHDGQQVGLDGKAKATEAWKSEKHVVVQERPRSKVCGPRVGHVDKEALGKVPQVKEMDIGWRISRDGNVAAAKGLEGVPIKLHEAFACLTEGLHGRVEVNGDLLATTVDFDVIECHVCEARIANLVEGLVLEGFEIATDLKKSTRAAAPNADVCGRTTYRIAMVSIHVLDDALLCSSFLCCRSRHDGATCIRWS